MVGEQLLLRGAQEGHCQLPDEYRREADEAEPAVLTEGEQGRQRLPRACGSDAFVREDRHPVGRGPLHDYRPLLSRNEQNFHFLHSLIACPLPARRAALWRARRIGRWPCSRAR